MIQFRFTMKDPDWRVVAAGFALAAILVLNGKADALVALAGDAVRKLSR